MTQCLNLQTSCTEHLINQELKIQKYQFAGKTGTSQVKRITEAEREADLDFSQTEYKNRDHAMYVAFAPYKDPRYSISVLIEHGGSGSKVAAPLAKKFIKKIIDRHEFRELKRIGSSNFFSCFQYQGLDFSIVLI